uniref:Papilinlike [Aplysia californica] n=1 Tax=Lepeophtheirus salmonis TaxID=72036 RepID=A0A0K2TMJ4_LEPSM
MDTSNSAMICFILGVILIDLSDGILKSTCTLNKDPGTCAKNITQYYFNKDLKSCESFTWGGCEGNKNRFDTVLECNDVCQPSSKELSDNHPELSQKKKTQESSDEDYDYYNLNFIQENKNEEVARNISDRDGSICGLPVEIGNCTKHSPRFFYNMQSGSCQFFIWKGCVKNENNFISIKKCLDKCHGVVKKESSITQVTSQCTLPPKNPSCHELRSKFFYNPKKNKCVKRLHCKDNPNGYDSLKICLRQCKPSLNINRCFEPRDPGTCTKNFRLKFYFDSKQNKCLKFYYSGCNGNGNRFDSITNCVLSCKLKEQFSFQGVGRAVKYLNYLLDPKLLIIATPTYDTCSLQSETGPCEESVVQYFHNAKTGKCETFVYGGCYGNGNNFDSMKSCEEHCIQNSYNDACLVEKRRGYCLKKKVAYHYDKNQQKCLSFIYGGCGGNANRFSTMDQCQKTCTPIKALSSASIYTYRNGLTNQFMERGNKYLRNPRLGQHLPRKTFPSSDSRIKQLLLYPLPKGRSNGHPFLLSQYINRKTFSSPEQEDSSSGYPFPRSQYNDRKTFSNMEQEENSNIHPFPPSQYINRKTFSSPGQEDSTNGHLFPPSQYINRKTFTSTEREDSSNLHPFPIGQYINRKTFSNPEQEDSSNEHPFPPNQYINKKTFSSPEQEDSGNGHPFPRSQYNNRKTFSSLEQEDSTNGNPFQPSNYIDLKAFSSPEQEEICLRPKFIGPCQNFVKRFYYNANSTKCESFYFGGCFDNGNHFKELESCINHCAINEYPKSCIEPQDVGECKEKIKKFYYEKDTGACHSFIYSGCGGNTNRFDSQRDCERICSPYFVEKEEERVEFHNQKESKDINLKKWKNNNPLEAH